MNQSQGGAAVARRVHTPEVAGSIPALATNSTPAGRGLPEACPCLLAVSSIRSAPEFALGHAAGGIFFLAR